MMSVVDNLKSYSFNTSSKTNKIVLLLILLSLLLLTAAAVFYGIGDRDSSDSPSSLEEDSDIVLQSSDPQDTPLDLPHFDRTVFEDQESLEKFLYEENLKVLTEEEISRYEQQHEELYDSGRFEDSDKYVWYSDSNEVLDLIAQLNSEDISVASTALNGLRSVALRFSESTDVRLSAARSAFNYCASIVDIDCMVDIRDNVYALSDFDTTIIDGIIGAYTEVYDI